MSVFSRTVAASNFPARSLTNDVLPTPMGPSTAMILNFIKEKPPRASGLYGSLKLKTKTEKENERLNQKKMKKCPQQTKIEYPPLSYKHQKMKPKYNPVDFVPRRKGKDQIMNEIESEYRNIKYDLKSGQDREKMKRELQKKLMNPGKGGQPLTAEEQKKIDEAIKRRKKQVEKKYMFRKETKEEKAEKKELEELNEMFEEVVRDIDDRQAFLKETTRSKTSRISRRFVNSTSVRP